MSENFLPQFSAQAILDLEQQEKLLRYDKTLGSYILALRAVVLLMRAAVHVILPSNGEIYRSNDVEHGDKLPPSPDEVESFCLPAPITCFQYSWTYRDRRLPVLAAQAPRRITLVSDGRQTHGEAPPGMVCCATLFSIVFDERIKKWTLLDHSLRLAEPLEIERFNVPWGYRAGLFSLMTGDDIRQRADLTGEWKSDISVLIQCCHALRAGATLVEKTEPSASRRWKFERKGVGGFTYHVLTLPQSRSNIHDGPVPHGSPRFHVRRAHIRKLPTGALTFVRQCFVGDKSVGVVEKDYRIKTAYGR